MEKKFIFYLLINFKTGEIQVKKRKPARGGYWVPIKMNITLEVPDFEPVIEAKLALSDIKINEMFIEEMTANGNEEDR